MSSVSQQHVSENDVLGLLDFFDKASLIKDKFIPGKDQI